MIKWRVVGKYLERNIQLTVCSDLAYLEPWNSLRDSVILTVLADSPKWQSNPADLFVPLINTEPLALAVYEQGGSIAFDTLIALLSRNPLTHHIMTQSIHENNSADALRAFLYSTWPAEEQFDNWKTYSIICLDSNMAASIVNDINTFFHKE